MAKKVAFIISSGHSGSSLLAVIMGSHPRCFSVGEINGIYNRYRQGKPIDCVTRTSDFWVNTFGEKGLEQLAKVFGNVRLNPNIPLKVDHFWHRITGRGQVFNPYSTLFDHLQGTEVIIDSSKALKWMKEKLNAQEFKTHQIEAYFIYLVRDGRAVMNSYLRKYKTWDMEAAAHKWVDKTRQSEALFEAFDPRRKIQIAYEDLASNPAQVISKLCELLQLDYQPDMLEYWKHEHHDISGNGGVYTLIQRYQKLAASETREVNGQDYYQKADFAIKLDLRWLKELPPDQLAIFERVAGEVNRPYEWTRTE
jgi:hypothetical protein